MIGGAVSLRVFETCRCSLILCWVRERLFWGIQEDLTPGGVQGQSWILTSTKKTGFADLRNEFYKNRGKRWAYDAWSSPATHRYQKLPIYCPSSCSVDYCILRKYTMPALGHSPGPGPWPHAPPLSWTWPGHAPSRRQAMATPNNKQQPQNVNAKIWINESISEIIRW